jgi:hypothetical protein
VTITGFTAYGVEMRKVLLSWPQHPCAARIGARGVISQHDNPEFEEAFGIYVGPATHDEVVAALRDLSELMVRIDNRESPRPEEGIRYRHGWPEHFHDKYEDDGGTGPVCRPPARAGARVRRDVPGCALRHLVEQ